MTEPYGDRITADLGGTLDIYNIDNLKAFVRNVVDNYFDLHSDKYFDEIQQDTDAMNPDQI